jgi:threonine 3-dehydrogenase
VKALVKAMAAPGLWLEDVPDPRPEPDDVVVEVMFTGICGTDLHIRDWDTWARKTVSPPTIIGHEFVGRVVEMGSNAGRDVELGAVVTARSLNTWRFRRATSGRIGLRWTSNMQRSSIRSGTRSTRRRRFPWPVRTS